MPDYACIDYERIEKAIAYLVDHVGEQPSLEEMAAQVHLSPFHFQRLFCQWAGTTPKRFLQVLTLERGKQLLQQSRSVLEVSHDIGLSGSSRLHDHFVQLEAVTPGEFKQKGRDLQIDYGVHATPFGPLFIAMTQRGICRASFVDFSSLEHELAALQQAWPLSILQHNESLTAPVVDRMFSLQYDKHDSLYKPFSLHVSGTNFQVAVWRALLKIPSGSLVSYSELANTLGYPKASRAVANAIGANPVAWMIPCHRVIRESGALGGYRWGVPKKQLIQTWERLHIAPADEVVDSSMNTEQD
ncbi:bifunctional transcriptional activator/DNA repair enzyme AdaA [Alkanindiges illinoisensis]|uniref:bifunctional transcriptional activator/DNA repair enzyme AdaA n=1 Tax=Alkanindiges illinoisensis TaxID=197183 RepID=UPI0004795CA6|nr:methylated-DNA--[protein]-cysteine S-methyltransferase [Alkanindiges illinoisensis]